MTVWFVLAQDPARYVSLRLRMLLVCCSCCLTLVLPFLADRQVFVQVTTAALCNHSCSIRICSLVLQPQCHQLLVLYPICSAIQLLLMHIRGRSHLVKQQHVLSEATMTVHQVGVCSPAVLMSLRRAQHGCKLCLLQVSWSLRPLGALASPTTQTRHQYSC